MSNTLKGGVLPPFFIKTVNSACYQIIKAANNRLSALTSSEF